MRRMILSQRFSSPLARWVRRHASLTTLFRSHDIPPLKNPSSLQVENFIISNSGLENVKVPSISTINQPLNQSANTGMETRIMPAPGDFPTQISQKANLSNTQPPEYSLMSQTVPKASDSEDPNWRRLKTIFRKHQEQTSKAAFSSQEEDIPSESLHRPVDESNHDGVTPSKFADLSPKVQSKKMDPENHLNKRPSESVRKPASVNPLENSLPLESVWPVESRLDPVSDVTDRPVTKAETQAGIPDGTSNERSIQAEINHPVQRLSISHETEPDKLSKPPEKEMLATQSAGPNIPERDQSSERPANKMITGVHSMSVLSLAQSPKEPVEVLPPTRPRPDGIPAFSTSSGEGMTPNNFAIQRQIHNENDLPEESEHQYIDTSIGPLPTDLWHLLGQPAPPVKTQQSATESNVVEKSPLPLPEHQIDTTSVLPNTNPPSSTVQRQEQSRTPVPHQSTESLADSLTEEGQPEIDLDDLARRVYAEIRQRLTIDQERIRK